ncbi:hypothetical protein [Flavobacterium sp. AED]|uniref:hypothetical protein n=1 Tax=Flavobacterium sp. AED TaxID=1423323 RepID=UPI00057FBFF9|nr:hypothetical protein [Flavobacterium sp. AED]KIA82715.1 hypothetical protein OA85_15825 [Flavobacterium sp. AED]MDI1303562.1 hypothetical protein [bacterium]
MRTLKYFPRTFRLLKNFSFRNKTENSSDSKNELIHPRFEVSKNDPLAQKIVPNSLLFLMYSEENEELFI